MIQFQAWDREKEREREREREGGRGERGATLAVIDGLVFTDHFLGGRGGGGMAVNMFAHWNKIILSIRCCHWRPNLVNTNTVDLGASKHINNSGAAEASLLALKKVFFCVCVRVFAAIISFPCLFSCSCLEWMYFRVKVKVKVREKCVYKQPALPSIASNTAIGLCYHV